MFQGYDKYREVIIIEKTKKLPFQAGFWMGVVLTASIISPAIGIIAIVFAITYFAVWLLTIYPIKRIIGWRARSWTKM